MSLFLTCLMIASVRVIDVALGTIRLVLSVRGQKVKGSLIGFVEVLIWFLIVREALNVESASFFVALAYAGGFGVGTYIGILLEEKLAIGNASIQVIVKGLRYDLVKVLRGAGFAVSTIITQGKDQENLMLMIKVNRKEMKRALGIIEATATDSFISVSDVKLVTGGYFPHRR